MKKRQRNPNPVRLPTVCCGETYEKVWDYANHRRKDHMPPGGYACTVCGFTSKEPGAIGKHMEIHDPVYQHQRFWSRVDKNGPVPSHRPDLGQCWVWTGAKSSKGYGHFKRPGGMGAPNGGAYVSTHRWAYETEVGPITEGLELDHLCRNTLCVRPDHLEQVTRRENLNRWAGVLRACPACGFTTEKMGTYLNHIRLTHGTLEAAGVKR